MAQSCDVFVMFLAYLAIFAVKLRWCDGICVDLCDLWAAAMSDVICVNLRDLRATCDAAMEYACHRQKKGAGASSARPIR